MFNLFLIQLNNKKIRNKNKLNITIYELLSKNQFNT